MTAAIEEAIAGWELCASIHRTFCRRDPFFTTRQKDFIHHMEEATEALNTGTKNKNARYINLSGWQEAVIAYSVCVSYTRRICKKD